MSLLLLFACVDTTLSNADDAPVVAILSPADGGGFEPGETLEVCVQVDDEDRLEELTLALRSDVDGALWESGDVPPPTCAGGNVGLSVTLTAAVHTLTFVASDTAGQFAEASVTLSPTDNQAPLCGIVSPADGDAFTVDDAIAFEGTATDPDDDPATLLAEVESDLDGVLWSGAPDSQGEIAVPDLALATGGDHLLTLTVTDPRGRVDVCGVQVSVDACLDEDLDGFTTCDEDCDDADGTSFPGGEEVADGADNDCDGVADDGTVLVDDDGDGWTELDGDCDDANPRAYPGATETWYDGTDQDCDGKDDDRDGDGFVFAEDCDDGDASVNPAAAEGWYDGLDQDCDGRSDFDQDGDGYDGDLYGGDDCDDLAATTSPAAAEAWYDGIDQDCDGRDDDQDLDGFGVADDCNDLDATVFPGATETWYDGVDQDCDGHSDGDQDGDGFDVAYDCDDTDATVNSAATETWYDGVDQDCDGASDYDMDADGYDARAHGGADCDDAAAGTNPGEVEAWYDGVDQDCDGKDDDRDGDGYGHADDCDDLDATSNPGAAEVWYDGVDQDCDGKDDDRDADGYPVADDCDDDDATVNPGAPDAWYDAVDQDCDGASDFDQDGDGFDADAYGGLDCDDLDEDVNPDATEVWYDGVDQDCDGASDYDADDDGYDSDAHGGVDCDDADWDSHPGGLETRDAADNDCDGYCDEGLLAAGDLVISEFMKDPNKVLDSEGEWVEVYNPGTVDVRMCNWEIADLDGETSVVDDVLVPAGDYVVLARNSNSAQNGGVSADYEYGDSLQMGNSADEIVLSVDGTVIDQVVYTSVWYGTAGYSYTLNPTLLTATANDTYGNWCKGTSAFGLGDRGTPGAANDGC